MNPIRIAQRFPMKRKALVPPSSFSLPPPRLLLRHSSTVSTFTSPSTSESHILINNTENQPIPAESQSQSQFPSESQSQSQSQILESQQQTTVNPAQKLISLIPEQIASNNNTPFHHPQYSMHGSEPGTQALTIRSLMAANLHMGHSAKQWNQNMLSYIYGERAGIVVDLALLLTHSFVIVIIIYKIM
jgi:hypothetical protein